MQLLLSKQEDLFLSGRKVLSTFQNKKNKEFARHHTTGQQQEQGEGSGPPLSANTANAQNRVDVLDGWMRLTLTPREVQRL